MILNISADLIQQYLMVGDFTGFIVAIYSQTLGTAFLGFILLALTIPIYIRTNHLGFVALIWFTVFGFMEILIPTAALSLGKVIMAMAVAVIMYTAFMGRSDY